MTDEQITKQALDSISAAVTNLADALDAATGARPDSISIHLPASTAGALQDLGAERSSGVWHRSGGEAEHSEWASMTVSLACVQVMITSDHVRRPATENEVLDLAEHGCEDRSRYRILS